MTAHAFPRPRGQRRGGPEGGEQGGDRIPRGGQQPQQEALQADPGLADRPTERVLPPATQNAKGVHHTARVRSVSISCRLFL